MTEDEFFAAELAATILAGRAGLDPRGEMVAIAVQLALEIVAEVQNRKATAIQGMQRDQERGSCTTAD